MTWLRKNDDWSGRVEDAFDEMQSAFNSAETAMHSAHEDIEDVISDMEGVIEAKNEEITQLKEDYDKVHDELLAYQALNLANILSTLRVLEENTKKLDTFLVQAITEVGALQDVAKGGLNDSARTGGDGDRQAGDN